MTNQIQALDQVRQILIERSMSFGPMVIVALVTLAAGVFVSRYVSKLLDKALVRFHLEPPIRNLLTRIARVVIIGLFLIIALQNLGIQLLPLIAGLGVAGAGIALAMQGVLANVVAGLTIIFTRPYRVGEYISISEQEGRVESINVFSTVLSHPDLSRVVIPNRKIVGEILHNYGKIRQANVTASVAYGTNLNHALAIIRDILQAHPLVLKDPAPLIQVDAMADSSVEIAVKPWTQVDHYITLHGDLYKAILEKFQEARVEVPFPQQEIRILNLPPNASHAS